MPDAATPEATSADATHAVATSAVATSAVATSAVATSAVTTSAVTTSAVATSAAARRVGRHPRLWGALFAALLLAAYVTGVRPAREWTAAHVAAPLFRSVDTPRARAFTIVRPSDYVPGNQPEAVFAVETARLAAGAAAGKAAPDVVREAVRAGVGVAYWVAPVGVLFLLPAMFLVFVFPTRPFWLVLLAYHLAVGAVSLAVFAVGLGWFAPAFSLYLFTRTYLTESVSLVVPLLLYLAARGLGPLAADRDAERT